MAEGVDHRRHHRYRLSIPVDVQPKAAAALRTSTQDISARGVYFVLSEGINLGSELELSLALPPEQCQGRSVRVHCRGRVVRRDSLNGQGKIGIAAIIEEYRFIKGAPFKL
jgi:c-di-GMP-binding flagellar brake protein YcgR